MLHLDGSTLEGGGQLVRNAVALSALTSQPVKISRIRGNRRGAGGLRASHSAAVNFLLEVCGGEVDGARVGSSELTFYPRGKEAYEADGADPSEKLLLPGGGRPSNSRKVGLPIKPEYRIRLATPGSIFLIFQALYPYLLYAGASAESDPGCPGPSIRLRITGGTNLTSSISYDYFSQVLIPNFAKLGLPGLAVQLNGRGWCTGRVELGTVSFTMDPLKTYRDAAVESELAERKTEKIPVFPNFRLQDFERGDITQIDITVLAPDFSLDEAGSRANSSRGPKGANKKKHQKYRTQQDNAGPDSEVEEELTEELDATLQAPIASKDRSAPGSIRRHVEDRVTSLLSRALKDGHNSTPRINLCHSEPTRHPLHTYLLLVAHTSTGFRLGRDALYGVNDQGGGQSQNVKKPKKKSNGQKRKKSALDDPESRIEDMVERCVSDLMYEMDNGDKRYLDTFMRDQVVVFQALGQRGAGQGLELNPSLGGNEDEELSLHAQTAMWVCEQMLA